MACLTANNAPAATARPKPYNHHAYQPARCSPEVHVPAVARLVLRTERLRTVVPTPLAEGHLLYAALRPAHQIRALPPPSLTHGTPAPLPYLYVCISCLKLSAAP